jgi:HlyD family secretion protein
VSRSSSSPPSPTSRPIMIFRSVSFYSAIVGIVLAVVLVRRVGNKPSAPGPVSPPARSPYAESLAASGLIEARGENVRIASQKPGVVAKVFVKVGDSVSTGAPLFQLNDRESRAILTTKEAELESLKAATLTRQVLLKDAEDQLQRGRKLREEGVITEEEINRRLFAAERAKAELVSAESQVPSAISPGPPSTS